MSFLNKYKFVFLALAITIAGVVIGMVIHNNSSTAVQTQATAGEVKTLAVEAKIEEVKEQVVRVAVDNSVDTVEEKVVKYKDKEIKIPKRKVAAAKDSEDGQKQKTAGENATVASFENDGQYVGIDVSSWQGNINWPQVAESGVQFAMIRVGFRGYAEEGNIKEDAYFRQNVKGAVSNGIKVGIYFYSTARNEEEALQEAAWVVDKIKSYAITYPVAYDFEEFGMHRTANISGEQATNNAIAFLNYVGSQGFGTMMYANKNDITKRFQKSRLPYKFWLAHYTTSTDYTGSYQMWQRTSKGSVPGISGYVDMNIAYFGYGSVAKPKHTHDFENGTVIGKITEPTCGTPGYKTMRCKECSESKKLDIPVTGLHKYSEWEVDEEKSAEGKIVLVRMCSVCKNKETKTSTERPNSNTTNEVSNEVNNVTNDNVVNNNTSQENNTIENEVVVPEPHNHEWDEGTITKDATCKDAGVMTYTCKTCTKTKTEEIPKSAQHQYSEEDGICNICGEQNPEFPKENNDDNGNDEEKTPTDE